MIGESAGCQVGDRVVVVTGASSGIGAATARRLSDDGAVVVEADLQPAPGRDGVRMFVETDVASAQDVAALIGAVLSRHGRVDHVVHAAGVGANQSFLDTPVELLDRILHVNLRGTFLVGQAFAMAMRETGGGSIVNIASVSGIRGNTGRAAYASSKGGVIALSQVMALELAEFGIRVNVIAPGPIESPLVAQMHTQAQRLDWGRNIPMTRYGQPEEVAAAAAFLCSSDASYITGHVLAVDGGFLGTGMRETSHEERPNRGVA